jgi:hypothetical protein
MVPDAVVVELFACALLGQHVNARTAIELIVAVAADQDVVSAAAGEPVVAVTAVERQ